MENDIIDNNNEENLKDKESSDSSDDITKNLNSIENEEKRQIADLEKNILELKDSYLRSQAEIQNIQKRTTEEIKRARDFAIASFVKDVVVIKDYLEMALLDKSNNYDTLKMGVDLTLKQLIQIFDKQMIKEINPEVNSKLDPNLHQAVESIEKEGFLPNTIISVKQKGYRLLDRVLRPAMVIVAK